MSPYESEALWRLFAGDKGGVAIESSYGELVGIAKLNDELYVGCVQYIDYEREWFPDGNLFYPVMHKRRAFGHECEVRLVMMSVPHAANHKPVGPPGLHAKVDLDALVKGIYVNPSAEEWYADAVTAVVEQLAPGLKNRVSWSKMKAAPLY
jgi:hypothetical protein